MTQFASLAWKEWHEVRWFVIVALCLFIGMPMVGFIEGRLSGNFHHFFFDAAPWVLTLGGVLAVMIAVGTVCSDLGGRREDFLRSRPLNLVRWVLVKYAIGLAAALLACVLPLIVEMSINNFSAYHTNIAINWYPFFWTAIYTLAFLCAVLVRRTAHATMLALAAMLLMYFLPIVLPFLQYMSIDWVVERSRDLYRDQSYTLPWGARVEPRQLLFIASMLAISAVSLAATILAVARDWRIESGTKMMYWSVGSSLLILFTSASLRLATNLPIEQQIDLPKSHIIWAMRMEGSRGILLTSDHELSHTSARTVQVTQAGLQLGTPVTLPQNHLFLFENCVAWPEKNPDVLYLSDYSGTRGYPRPYDLRTISLSTGSEIAPPIRVWESASPQDDVGRPRLFVIGDRLYGLGGKVAVLDISQPAQPRLLSVERLRFQRPDETPLRNGMRIPLPKIAELPPRQRLLMWDFMANRALDGDVVAVAQGESISTYKLDELNDDFDHFTPVAQYQPTLLEHVFGAATYKVTAGGGFAFVSTFGLRIAPSDVAAKRMNVFDIRDPQRPHPVGHFSAPAERQLVISPVGDGRAIVGADNRLYLTGRPPARE